MNPEGEMYNWLRQVRLGQVTITCSGGGGGGSKGKGRSDPFLDAVSLAAPLNSTFNKETKMNIENLVALAGVSGNDEFSKYDALPENIQAVLKRKAKEAEEAKVEAAAEAILELVTFADNSIQGRVAEIRSLRRSVEAHKAKIEAIERAKAFGMETQNFLPLVKLLGYNFRCTESDLVLDVPADWKPKAVSVQKRAAK